MARGLSLIRTCELRIWKHEANLYELEEHKENHAKYNLSHIICIYLPLKFLLKVKFSFNLGC